MSTHEIQSAFSDFDSDGSGGIDFFEFLELIQCLMRKLHPTLEEVLSILRSKPSARKPAELARLARYPSSYLQTLIQGCGTSCRASYSSTCSAPEPISPPKFLLSTIFYIYA